MQHIPDASVSSKIKKVYDVILQKINILSFVSYFVYLYCIYIYITLYANLCKLYIEYNANLGLLGGSQTKKKE